MRLHPKSVLGILASLALAASALAQANPRGMATLSVNGKAVSVEYGRPSLKGRSVADLLGRLRPGAVWRLGADKSTTFSTETDLAFGDVTVPPGEYSLWARKTEGGWNLVFNKQHGQWGTQHDPAQDFASAPLKEEKAAKSEETLNISLAQAGSGGALTIHWGDMKLSTNFAAK
jgi:hypothetical protein